MNNLAVKTQNTKHETKCAAIVEKLESHLQYAARHLETGDDLRYFTMRDLQGARLNLFLAQELLQLLKFERS